MSTTTDPTESPEEAATARRPGGRSARVRDAVYAAVAQLVNEGHLGSMTIPQVAARAGVNPTSVYRRWGTIEALCGEVAVAALVEVEDLPDTGSVAGDLQAWAVIIAEDIERPARTTYLKALAASRTQMVDDCPCWAQRREQAVVMARRAQERGERTPTPMQMLDHIVAPLYHHAVFGLSGGPRYAHQLVDDVLAMAR